MKPTALDHLVLTVRDIERTVTFYCDVLGMTRETFAGGRVALRFGNQKINLHQQGAEFLPNATLAAPGTADLCILVQDDVAGLKGELEAEGVEIIEGPVPRTGACTGLMSIYLRDPDGNLLELSNPVIEDQ